MLIYREENGCHKASHYEIPVMSFREIMDIKRGPGVKALTKKEMEALKREK